MGTASEPGAVRPPLVARVVVLAGPSGAGKSRVAELCGLPVLRLDDFYKDGDDPTLPRIATGGNAGVVDWDDPASWHLDQALAAVVALCRAGCAEVPVYELAADGRTGSRVLDLGGATTFVAEGIFATEVVRALTGPDPDLAGVLAAAYCVRRHPVVTFWRRLVRDLRERRKPPPVLVRRGLALMRQQRSVVDAAVAAGCTPLTGDQALTALAGLSAGRRTRA